MVAGWWIVAGSWMVDRQTLSRPQMADFQMVNDVVTSMGPEPESRKRPD